MSLHRSTVGQLTGQMIGIAFSALLAVPAWAQGASSVDARAAVATSPRLPDSIDLKLQAALDILREKGVLTDKEYETALQRRQAEAIASALPASAPAPVPAPNLASVLTGKFDMSMYGFIELDGIFDSTQSFNELAGNALVARPGTFAGEHGRTLVTMRNSRLGFKVRTPQWQKVSLHGTFEFDLLGNQPPNRNRAPDLRK